MQAGTLLVSIDDSVQKATTEQLRLQSLQRAATANGNSLSLARQRYQAGLSSFLEVLDAERRLYASQTEVVRSNVTISTDLIAVYKSIGGGWDVAPPVPDTPPAQPAAAK